MECRAEYVLVDVSARAAAEHWDEVWNRRGDDIGDVTERVLKALVPEPPPPRS